MKLICIPALIDNYIWILSNKEKKSIIIDPGDANPVLKIINNFSLLPVAIFLTHYHKDHVMGVKKILRYYSIPSIWSFRNSL